MEYQGTSDRLADSVEEAGHRIGIGRSTMWKLVREGTIPTITIARRRLVTREAQAEFVRSLEQTA